MNLAEIESPEFPGERLIACYNPLLAEKRRRKREQLLAATEEMLAKLARGVSLRTKKPLSSAEIGVKAGRVIGRHKMAKHIRLTIHDGSSHGSMMRTRSGRGYAGWDLCGPHQRTGRAVSAPASVGATSGYRWWSSRSAA